VGPELARCVHKIHLQLQLEAFSGGATMAVGGEDEIKKYF
jgi:hypothetical protein